MNSSPRGRRPSALNHLDRVKAAPGLSAVSESIGPESVVPYEIRLTRNPGWALSEGSRHFEEKSKVFAALQKIAKRLDSLGIPYAVAGGMALFQHGLRRFTEDVDILVSKGDLKKIHEKLETVARPPGPIRDWARKIPGTMARDLV